MPKIAGIFRNALIAGMPEFLKEIPAYFVRPYPLQDHVGQLLVRVEAEPGDYSALHNDHWLEAGGGDGGGRELDALHCVAAQVEIESRV
jgi:hypothetical protein